MKKTFLLIVACVFAFTTVQAQSSEVEATTQLTKAEQFKQKNSFIKEDKIYKYKGQGVQLFAKLFTDLKTGEQLVALEFHPTAGQQIMNSMTGVISQPLGYLDMEAIDDLILALEMIVETEQTSDKKDEYSITYMAPGGIDVFFDKYEGNPYGSCTLRKKWYSIDDYGMQTTNYSEGWIFTTGPALPKLISAIKEAQAIANQALAK